MSVPVRLLLWNQVVESQGHIPLTQLAASYQLILEPKVPFGAELGIGDLVLPGLAASEPDNRTTSKILGLGEPSCRPQSDR
jgi:hypothetical protein